MRRCCTSSASGFDAVVSKRLLTIGDSKTSAADNTWPVTLTAALNVAAAPSTAFALTNIGAAASTAAYWAAGIDAALAAINTNHSVVLVNIGVNDFGVATEAAWKADMAYTLDAVHTRWPHAAVYLMRPWKRGFNATADTYATWIADLIVTRSSWLFSGPDERSWLKGADDGATMTTDGIHYSVAGEAEAPEQWLTTLGY